MHSQKNMLLLAFIMVLSLGFAACGRSTPTEPAPESPLSFESPQAAPTVPPASIASPRPMPAALHIPTPAPDTAVVHGRVVASAPETSMFLAGDIYLASVRSMGGENNIPFVRLDPNNDPKATLRNEANEFAIVDVPPGRYSLVFHTPINDYIVSEENGNEFQTIEVEAGEMVDLGTIELR